MCYILEFQALQGKWPLVSLPMQLGGQFFFLRKPKSREKWKTVFGVHHVRTLFVTMDKMNQPYKIAVGVEILGDSGFQPNF